ncbi:MAG: PQQ-dependent sugar dehydrogenase, partial [Anaerolineales bacterium]|nr:PQQ-dependent sugar dehydrogenase [Anaerolineales bacterium]
LTLPLLACGGLAEPVTPTATPLASPPRLTVAPTSQTDSQPVPDPATPPPSANPIINAGSFPNAADYEWQLIASGLNRPVDIQPANDGSGRLFIIEKLGYIRVYENGQLLDTPFLDITDRVDDSGNEMGFLGLAFHPDYEQNGFFYVNYTGDGGNTRISRFQASGNSVDSNSETVLLMIEQPYPNHNGGALAFGPDGYLYAGLGDGGLAGDPHKNGQNTTALLGKILRIDVNNGDPYAIPSDNPFGNEVWAYGLRNPWRISFDRATGDLWIGDVGQGQWEEIDYLPAGSQGGANFGWSIMEGNHGYDGQTQPGLLLPVAEYSHSSGGCSVTGGYVYRGSMTEWNGIYFYGDYCSGYVWGLILADGGWQSQLLFETDARITSFGQDESGEIYFASDAGGIYVLAKK